MKKIRNILVLICALALVCTAGCSEAGANKFLPEFVTDTEISTVESGTLAENQSYRLDWDDEKKCLLMYSAEGQIWSSTPYESYLNPATVGLAPIVLNSPITIKYIDEMTGQVSEARSYTSAQNSGRVSVAKIDNGIRIEYYFDIEQIMIPVEFILHEDRLEARIDVKSIQEGDLKLTEISVLPYIAAAQNNGGGYLFVPSGSGAVISAVSCAKAMSYSEPVYGTDVSETKNTDDTRQSQAYLPVFGASNGSGTAILGIVEQGADKAIINATSGSTDIGYSNAWASFQIRSKDSITLKAMSTYEQTKTLFSDEVIDDEYLSVSYYPLVGEKANISGMAECYRDYLKAKGLAAKTDDERLLYVNIIGGEMIETSVLSVPVNKLYAATTLEQAEEIADYLKSKVGADELLLSLTGYGSTGMTNGKPAGGMTVAKKLGGVKGFNRFSEWCTENNIPMFMNFELLQFNSSGSGISTWGDVAKTTNNSRATRYYYDYETRDKNTDDYPVNLLVSRSKVMTISEKLMKKTDKWKLSGVSFASLSSLAYSDGDKYVSKDGMSEDAQKILKAWKEDGHSVLSVSPNSYAAVSSDYIISAPTGSSENDSFTEDVPFYQMVFKGIIPISSTPINLCADMQTEFLNAVSTGSGLCFSTYYTYDTELKESPHSVFLSSEYNVIKDEIVKMANDAADLHKAVKGSEIKTYSRNGNITQTVFENGITVYANYGDTVADTPLGSVEGKGFIYGQEGA